MTRAHVITGAFGEHSAASSTSTKFTVAGLSAVETQLQQLGLWAVLRTGPGPSWLIQSHGRGLCAEDSAYRRDSRLEIVLEVAPTEEFLEAWRSLMRDAPLPA